MQILSFAQELVCEKDSAKIWCVKLYGKKIKTGYIEEKGILSLPSPKSGRSLSPETVDMVHVFDESDKISSYAWQGFCLSKR